MWPYSEKTRTAGSVVTTLGAVIGVVWWLAGLNSRVGHIEEQMRSFAASSGATAVADDRLSSRVSQLEEGVRSLAASSAATTAAITEIGKKPMVAINPILQKCAELADEANTGQRSTFLGSHYGADVTKNALMAMEKLGCSSTVR